MVKKTITICDICRRDDNDEDEDIEAEEECVICKKDICGTCSLNYCVDIGEEDENEYKRLKWIICRDCCDKISFKEKEDKVFLNKLEKNIITHLKQKVMLGELLK